MSRDPSSRDKNQNRGAAHFRYGKTNETFTFSSPLMACASGGRGGKTHPRVYGCPGNLPLAGTAESNRVPSSPSAVRMIVMVSTAPWRSGGRGVSGCSACGNKSKESAGGDGFRGWGH